ncbi:hypothetical protein V6N12_031451 [Hibiscus sabdariffa]
MVRYPRTPSGGCRPLGADASTTIGSMRTLGCGSLAQHRRGNEPRVWYPRTPSGGGRPLGQCPRPSPGHRSTPPPPVRFPAVLRRDSGESPTRLFEGNTTLPHPVPPSLPLHREISISRMSRLGSKGGWTPPSPPDRFSGEALRKKRDPQLRPSPPHPRRKFDVAIVSVLFHG